MALCTFCQRPTHLYDSGIPICIECCEARSTPSNPSEVPDGIETILRREVQAASARAKTASDAFRAVMGDIPSGLPHPDGTHRIQNVSGELSAARKDMMKAHARLNDFLKSGIVPIDLKRGRGA